MSDTQKPVSDIYAVFVGDINQDNTGKIVNGITTAIAQKTPRIHLAFQSFGGFVGDGVFLYNFFRALPIEVILYNCGSVYSIASIAYLGAQKRKVSASAAFMIHRTHVTPQRAGAENMQALTDAVVLDNIRTEGILRTHLELPDEQWTVHQYGDLHISAADAVKFKLAHEIGEFSPPLGQQIFQIR